MSYLLQGVESAWDSIGRRNPQTKRKNHPLSVPRHEPDGAAGASVHSGDRGDVLRGAEAMVDVPQAGNNVSLAIRTTPRMIPSGF